MEHRKQAIDVVALIVQLTGFVVLIGLFFPAVRRAFTGFGLIGVCTSIFMVMGLIGFSVYRLMFRPDKMTEENPFVSANHTPNPNGSAQAPEVSDAEASEPAPDILEPALRRRYPWRHEMADHS